MMDDLISRQAVIDRAVPFSLFGKEVMFVAVSQIEDLPAARPKMGKWIRGTRSFVIDVFTTSDKQTITCSECGSTIAGLVGRLKYCPNCGARMMEGVEDEG